MRGVLCVLVAGFHPEFLQYLTDGTHSSLLKAKATFSAAHPDGLDAQGLQKLLQALGYPTEDVAETFAEIGDNGQPLSFAQIAGEMMHRQTSKSSMQDPCADAKKAILACFIWRENDVGRDGPTYHDCFADGDWRFFNKPTSGALAANHAYSGFTRYLERDWNNGECLANRKKYSESFALGMESTQVLDCLVTWCNNQMYA